MPKLTIETAHKSPSSTVHAAEYDLTEDALTLFDANGEMLRWIDRDYLISFSIQREHADGGGEGQQDPERVEA